MYRWMICRIGVPIVLFGIVRTEAASVAHELYRVHMALARLNESIKASQLKHTGMPFGPQILKSTSKPKKQQDFIAKLRHEYPGEFTRAGAPRLSHLWKYMKKLHKDHERDGFFLASPFPEWGDKIPIKGFKEQEPAWQKQLQSIEDEKLQIVLQGMFNDLEDDHGPATQFFNKQALPTVLQRLQEDIQQRISIAHNPESYKPLFKTLWKSTKWDPFAQRAFRYIVEKQYRPTGRKMQHFKDEEDAERAINPGRGKVKVFDA